MPFPGHTCTSLSPRRPLCGTHPSCCWAPAPATRKRTDPATMDTEADTHGDLDGTPAPNAEQLARARRNLENAKRIRLQRATARQPVVREDFGGAGKKAGGFFATLHTETSRPLPKVAESEPSKLPLRQWRLTESSAPPSPRAERALLAVSVDRARLCDQGWVWCQCL